MRPRLKQLKQLTTMVFARSAQQQWLFLNSRDRKQFHKIGDGSNTSVVAAPVLWIGRNFPEAPSALWKKVPDSGEEERVSGMGDQGGDHPMLELIERPNQYYSGTLLWMSTIMDWHLSGNAYWLKLRDGFGRPKELWWVPSGLMKPCGDEKTFIKEYEYKPGIVPISIPSDDVVHFRYGMDPENPRLGRSPLSSLLHEVYTDEEASEFVTALLSNMGVPGLVVAPKSDGVLPDDVRATKDYMKNAFTGDKRGEPIVMSGPTSVTSFGFNPQQMQLREIRRIPEERVSACLGVPAIVAGLGAGLDRSTFANMEEARQMAYADNILPGQRIVSEEVRFQLLPDFQPNDYRAYRFGFDTSQVRVLQEDRNALAARFDVGIKGGWVRVSEGRRAMDLEVDDADEIYLRGVQTVEVPVGEVAPVALPPLSPGGQPAQLPPEQQPEDVPPEDMPMNRRIRFQGKKIKATRLQSRLVIALERDKHALVIPFSSDLVSTFNELGASCAETFLHMTSQSSRQNGHGVKEFDAEHLARLIAATVNASYEDRLQKNYTTHVMRTIQQVASTLETVANLTGGVSEVAQQQLLEAGGKRVGLLDLMTTTKNSVFHSINEGNQQGSNPRDIARTIRTEVPSGRFVNAGPTYRAQLIARTETNWSANSATIAAYRDADVVSGVVAMDGGDDPECAERDGQEFTFDEAEAELEKEHPNGTLAFAPVVGSTTEVPA